ncbi:MAG: site-specific integrase [Tenuifilaceae bacterium]
MKSHTPTKITFWLNSCKSNNNRLVPIYLRVTQDKKYFTMTTGKYIQSSDWDKKRGKVKGVNDNAVSVNEHLETIKLKIQRIINQLEISNKPFTVFTIKDILRGKNSSGMKFLKVFDSHIHEINNLLGKDYSQATLIKYKTTRSRLAEFITIYSKRIDIDVDEVNNEFMDGFITFLKTNYNNSQNTCHKQFQRLSKILRIAVQRGYCTEYPLKNYSVKKPSREVEYLTQDEIDRIACATVHIHRLELIRDFFVFSCYTGLGFSEIEKLSMSDLMVGGDNHTWINVKRKKTGKTYQVPLFPIAQEILNKYKGTSNNDKVFPVPSNSKYNAYLKEIAVIAGISKNLTTHLARKSFSVSVCLTNGISIGSLSLLLGHSSIGITISAYSKIVDRRLLEEVGTLRNRLAVSSSSKLISENTK